MSSLEERVKILETKFNSLTSLLEEYLATIIELQNKIYSTNTSNNTEELAREHILGVPLSSLKIEDISIEDELKEKIRYASELLIKYGKEKVS